MRRIEDNKDYKNYFKSDKIQQFESVDAKDRDYCVKRVIDLCIQKGYRQETLHLAINIFDMALEATFDTIKKDQLPLYIVSCTILAAKME